MEIDQSEYLAQYEEKLLLELLRQASDEGILEGQLLAVEELEERWHTSAPEYMAAAVPQIAQYPSVAIAWAGYVGIGATVLWDTDWDSYAEVEDIYSLLAAPRGFDELDEYVVEGLLGYKLESAEAERVENIMRNAANLAQTMIRKEAVEPQSVMAFHIFARTAKSLYRLGIAIGLRLLGYRYEKMQIGEN
ncbi:MAG: hypothetical protein SNH63_02935 [Rikenellaceae bacterium]